MIAFFRNEPADWTSAGIVSRRVLLSPIVVPYAKLEPACFVVLESATVLPSPRAAP